MGSFIPEESLIYMWRCPIQFDILVGFRSFQGPHDV